MIIYSQIKAPDLIKKEFSFAKSVYVFITELAPSVNLDSFSVAEVGLGEDYHIILRNYMSNFVSDNFDADIKYEICCDDIRIKEKELACLAGLGRISRNNLFYSDTLKCFPCIGEIITDIECDIEPDYGDCRNFECTVCNKCEKACPTNSIKDFSFNKETCISYITQKSGELTEGEKKVIGKHLYGCDICQSVCPLLSRKQVDIDDDLSINKLADLTTLEFKELRAKYPFTWIGKNKIKRNAKIILENSKLS